MVLPAAILIALSSSQVLPQRTYDIYIAEPELTTKLNTAYQTLAPSSASDLYEWGTRRDTDNKIITRAGESLPGFYATLDKDWSDIPAFFHFAIYDISFGCTGGVPKITASVDSQEFIPQFPYSPGSLAGGLANTNSLYVWAVEASWLGVSAAFEQIIGESLTEAASSFINPATGCPVSFVIRRNSFVVTFASGVQPPEGRAAIEERIDLDQLEESPAFRDSVAYTARILGNGNHLGGGVVVHPEYVLTADRIVGTYQPIELEVVVGDVTISAVDSGEELRGVVASTPVGNRLALLKLSSPISVSRTTRVLELGVAGVGSRGSVSGWAGGRLDILSSAIVNIGDSQVCSAVAPRAPGNGEFCAVNSSRFRTSGVCRTEMGSGFVIQVDGVDRLAGIVVDGVVGNNPPTPQYPPHANPQQECTSSGLIVEELDILQLRSLIPSLGNVRARWRGNLANLGSTFELSCSGTGENVSGSLLARGVELVLPCASTVGIHCSVNNPQGVPSASVDELNYRLNGGVWLSTLPPVDSRPVAASSVLEFECVIDK